MNELDRYAVSLENMEVLCEKVAEQAREIERIDAGAKKIATYAVSLEQELAALKAKPSGVVRWPEADEIMQMAFEEGQPSEDASGYYFELEEFDLFIQRLMEEVARLNQPASSNTIDLVFDGELPNAVFVEAEDGDGNSINAGHWFQREDGYLVLRISSVECQPTQKESDAAAHRYLAQVNKTKPASAGDERSEAWDGKSLPYGWVAVQMLFDGPDYPEDFAYGPPRMMERLSGILERYYATRFAPKVEPVNTKGSQKEQGE